MGDGCFQSLKIFYSLAGEAGDKVLSYNEESGQNEYQEVARLFRNTANEFLKIQVEGEAQAIQVTLGHPFYVHRNKSNLSVDLSDDGDWVLSKSLRVGDLLKDKAGEWKQIVSIQRVEETQATYNFEVAKNHDYFVGENGWLVHNQSRSYPLNLTEELIMEEATSGGGQGVEIMQGTKWGDPKFQNPGWKKFEYVRETFNAVGNRVKISVHYMKNSTTGDIQQVKIKTPPGTF